MVSNKMGFVGLANPTRRSSSSPRVSTLPVGFGTGLGKVVDRQLGCCVRLFLVNITRRSRFNLSILTFAVGLGTGLEKAGR